MFILTVSFGGVQVLEKFKDTNGLIRIPISKKNRQHNTMAKWKSTKGQTTIYKTYT
jgi:hypothetical protein